MPPISDANANDPFINRVIAGYKLLQHAGKGGMGSVYLAREESSGKSYAFKILKPELASNEKDVRRFAREARIIGSLNHPHVIKIRTAGEAENVFYLVMDFISGWTLSDLIKNNWITSVDSAVHIAEQIALALAAVHAHGIIHRDVKPHNVLMTKDMRARLTDFGLGKQTSGDTTSLTSTGNILGTPIYMAPEQWRGEPPTPQTDLYALGVLLYEMLTGRPPFKADTPHSLMLHALQHELPPASNLNPKVDSALDRIIHDMTAIDPAKRYASAESLAEDLRAHRKGELQRGYQRYVIDADLIEEIAGSARHEPATQPIKTERVESLVKFTRSMAKGAVPLAILVASIAVLFIGLSSLPAAFERMRSAFSRTSPWTSSESGFQPLFNGTDLTGWVGNTHTYRVENGELVGVVQGGRPQGHSIFTEAQYRNFVLRLEFNLTPGANSGVGLRIPADREIFRCLEVQIVDDFNTPNLPRYNATGAIYGIAPSKEGHLLPPGEWNSQEIIARDRRITVILNGTEILDVDLDEAGKRGTLDGGPLPISFESPSGHIGLLGNKSSVRFRNLRIKPI